MACEELYDLFPIEITITGEISFNTINLNFQKFSQGHTAKKETVTHENLLSEKSLVLEPNLPPPPPPLSSMTETPLWECVIKKAILLSQPLVKGYDISTGRVDISHLLQLQVVEEHSLKSERLGASSLQPVLIHKIES